MLDTNENFGNINNLSCNCTTSPFLDRSHGHIITEDIRIAQINKLRKLLRKGPKYREPVFINFSNCKTEIKNSLTNFSSGCCNKKRVPVKCSTQWINLVIEKVFKRIKNLKNEFKFNKLKQIFWDPRVISYLKNSQVQHLKVQYDKATNNIAVICKKYYVQVLLKELGLLNTTSNTYEPENDSLHNILQQQINTIDSTFGIKNNDKELNCPLCIYWFHKMHKIPTVASFITARKRYISKQLSKNVTSVFKPCYSQIETYHKNKHIILVKPKPLGQYRATLFHWNV